MYDALRHLQFDLAVAQLLLRAPALRDVAHQRQPKPMCSVLEFTGANFDGKHASVLAPVKRLEGHSFTSGYPLPDPRDGSRVQADIEVARTHSYHLLAAVTQALARLTVDVENGLPVVQQEEPVRRVIDEATKTLLALPQGILSLLALGDVAHQAQVASSALFELAQANFHREARAVLAPMAGLESDGFAAERPLLQARDRRIVEADIKIGLVLS